RRHTRCLSDWSSDVCSSDLKAEGTSRARRRERRASKFLRRARMLHDEGGSSNSCFRRSQEVAHGECPTREVHAKLCVSQPLKSHLVLLRSLTQVDHPPPLIFAHVSRSPTVRLNTGLPGRESASRTISGGWRRYERMLSCSPVPGAKS